MKKNKLIAYAIILLTLLIPVNFGLLQIDDTQGVFSLIMMIILQFAMLAALLIGIDKK